MFGTIKTKIAEEAAERAIDFTLSQHPAPIAPDRKIRIKLRQWRTYVSVKRTDISAAQYVQMSSRMREIREKIESDGFCHARWNDSYYAYRAIEKKYPNMRGYVVRIEGKSGGGILVGVVISWREMMAVVRSIIAQDATRRTAAEKEAETADGKVVYRTFSGGQWGPPKLSEILAQDDGLDPADDAQAVHMYRYHDGWLTWMYAHAPRGCSASRNQRASRPMVMA